MMEKENTKKEHNCPKCGADVLVSYRSEKCIDEYYRILYCTKCDWYEEKEVG